MRTAAAAFFGMDGWFDGWMALTWPEVMTAMPARVDSRRSWRAVTCNIAKAFSAFEETV